MQVDCHFQTVRHTVKYCPDRPSGTEHWSPRGWESCSKAGRPQAIRSLEISSQLRQSPHQGLTSFPAPSSWTWTCRGSTSNSAPSTPPPPPTPAPRLLLPLSSLSHCSSHTPNSTGRSSPLRSWWSEGWVETASQLNPPVCLILPSAPLFHRCAQCHVPRQETSCLPRSVSESPSWRAQPAAKKIK